MRTIFVIKLNCNLFKSKSKSRPGSGKSIVSVAWEENEEKTSVEENGEPEDEEEEEGLHHEEDLGPLVIKGEDDIPKGCWFAFLQSFNGLWSTKDMNDGMDREIEVRTTVRELVIYLLFLFVIVICKNFTILLYCPELMLNVQACSAVPPHTGSRTPT